MSSHIPRQTDLARGLGAGHGSETALDLRGGGTALVAGVEIVPPGQRRVGVPAGRLLAVITDGRLEHHVNGPIERTQIGRTRRDGDDEPVITNLGQLVQAIDGDGLKRSLALTDATTARALRRDLKDAADRIDIELVATQGQAARIADHAVHQADIDGDLAGPVIEPAVTDALVTGGKANVRVDSVPVPTDLGREKAPQRSDQGAVVLTPAVGLGPRRLPTRQLADGIETVRVHR